MSGFTEYDDTPTFEKELPKKIAERLTDQFSRPDFDDDTKDDFNEALSEAIKTKLETQFQTQTAPEAKFEDVLSEAISEKLKTQLSTTTSSDDKIKPKFLRALAKLFKDRIAKPNIQTPDFKSTLQSKIAEHLEKTLINTASITTDTPDLSTAPSWIQNFMGIFSKLPKFDSVKPPDKEKLENLFAAILAGLTPGDRVKFAAKGVGYFIASPVLIPGLLLYFGALKSYQMGKILYPELEKATIKLVELVSKEKEGDTSEPKAKLIRDLLDKLNAYFKPKKHNNLINTLKKAVEDLIERKKNKQAAEVERPKNKMLRFTFEDTSFTGQLKKRIQETIYRQLMTDDVRIQLFIAKYEKDNTPIHIYRNIYNDIMLIENIIEKNRRSVKTDSVEKYTRLRDSIIQAFNYQGLREYLDEDNFDAVKYAEYYESVANLRELGEKLKLLEDESRNPEIQSKRILMLACSIATDKQSIATIRSIVDRIDSLGDTHLPTFYGQLLRFENEYPNYTAKSLQKYTALLEVLEKDDGNPASILKIKTMDDVCAKVQVIEKKLKQLKQSQRANMDANQENASGTCKTYFEEETLRMDNSRTMYVSDLHLLQMCATYLTSTKKCKAKNILQKIVDLISGVESDMSAAQKRANPGPDVNTITSNILMNINNRLKKGVSAKGNVKPPSWMSDKLKRLAELMEKKGIDVNRDLDGKSASTGQGNLGAPLSESVTPNYEESAGYGTQEGDDPEGVPVSTSINPATGNGYVDYVETVYVGSYFAYEFHEEQDPAKYATGPWVFKETFSVPPTIDKAPEQFIRKITMSGAEASPTIGIQHDKETGALMNAGSVNKSDMDKFYYMYFGKSRIIDAKKKADKDSSMEYDDDNTHIIRMKDALFELIERKKTKTVDAVPPGESPIPETMSDIIKAEIKDKMETAANMLTQTVKNATVSIANIIPGQDGEFTKKLKSEIETKLKSMLSGNANQSPFVTALTSAIQAKLASQFQSTPSGNFQPALTSAVQAKLAAQLSPGQTSSQPLVSVNQTSASDDTFTQNLTSAIQKKLTSMFSSQNPGDFLDTLKQKIQEKLTTTLTAANI